MSKEKLVERIVVSGRHNGVAAGGTVEVSPREADRFKDKLRDPRTAEENLATQQDLEKRARVAEGKVGTLEQELGAANEATTAAEAERDAAVARAEAAEKALAASEKAASHPPAPEAAAAPSKPAKK